MIYGYINANKVVKETVEDDLNIVSVAYDEFCNYSSMLESCTDENERAILEAKCEVLYEVSFKDIIEKLKQMWEDFKAWVKKVWNAIFHNKKATDKVVDDMVDKVKKDLDEFSKTVSDAMDYAFSGKGEMKKASVLSDLKVPVYYAGGMEELTDNFLFKNASFGGDIMDTEVKYTLTKILHNSDTMIKIHIHDGEHDIDHESEKSDTADSIRTNKEEIEKEIEKIDKIEIKMLPIVENKDNNVFMVYNRLEKYGIKIDGSSEENLRSVWKCYDTMLEGFKSDYVKVYGYKSQIDKNINKYDMKIKKILNDMHKDIEDYAKYSKKYQKAKDSMEYISNDPFGYEREYEKLQPYNPYASRASKYQDRKDEKKYYGTRKYYNKKDANSKHDTVVAIRELINAMHKAVNSISGLSAKIVSAEQKTAIQLGKLDKIILDMTAKAEKKDDNEI